jgi:hypothetical protein
VASIPGSQFAYGGTTTLPIINLVSNPGGVPSSLPSPISGDFNLELVTVAGITSIPTGWQGVAQVSVDSPTGANSVTMLLGSYGVTDTSTGDTITAGTGNDTIFGNVHGDHIVFGSGSDAIFGAASDTINGTNAGSGSYIDATGGNDSVALGNVANFVSTQEALFGVGDTIAADSSNWQINTQWHDGALQSATVAANMNVTLGAGADTVFGAVGDTINGENAGANSYIDATLGHQAVTLGSVTNFAPAEQVAFGFADTIHAGSGGWVINTQFQQGTQQSPTVAANMDVWLGSGADSVYGAAGDTITGGPGANQYIDFAAGHGGAEFLNDDSAASGASSIGGSASVYNFDQATGDRIVGDSAAQAQAIVTASTASGSNTVLHLTDGTQITLIGVSHATFGTTFFQ